MSELCCAAAILYLFFYLVSLRLKSVKNIQKITKSMKMVAAAKYARAERELKPARTFGQGSLGKCMINCSQLKVCCSTICMFKACVLVFQLLDVASWD